MGEGEDRWRRVRDPGALRAGDLVFTQGFPDHVFVFAAWRHRRTWVASVIDNHGFTHSRELFPRPRSGLAAFAYGLRPPLLSTTPVVPANCGQGAWRVSLGPRSNAGPGRLQLARPPAR